MGHSFNIFLFANTKNHKKLLNGNIFSNFLKTPIVLINEIDKEYYFFRGSGDAFQIGKMISDQNIEPEMYYHKNYIHHPYFKYGCSEITITNCVFKSCYADTYHGESIHIEGK